MGRYKQQKPLETPVNELDNPNIKDLGFGAFLITFLVRPKAKQDNIYKDGDAFCIDIAAAPMKGQANTEIIKFLGRRLDIPKSQIELIKGMTVSTKTFKIIMPKTSRAEFQSHLLNDHE